jgi:hypothetical protein
LRARKSFPEDWEEIPSSVNNVPINLDLGLPAVELAVNGSGSTRTQTSEQRIRAPDFDPTNNLAGFQIL